jgi:hypothetical protein
MSKKTLAEALKDFEEAKVEFGRVILETWLGRMFVLAVEFLNRLLTTKVYK